MSSQPPVTWPEIRDHLTGRLMLDPEWTVHAEEDLIWQPWLLPVHIGVLEHGLYDDGFPWVAVKAWTRVAELPEEPGLAVAQAGNRACPMATFFHDDGQVIASVGVTLNGDGRSNLYWFHSAVLAMASVAHELATEVLAGLQPPNLDPGEAPLGRRHEPDDLLSIFAGHGWPPPTAGAMEQAVARWPQARPLVVRQMQAAGHPANYRDDTLDSYDFGGVHVATRLQPAGGRYGPGLQVVALWPQPADRATTPPALVNELNTLLGSRCYTNVGHVRGTDPEPGGPGLELASYLPGPFLAEFRSDPQLLATVVVNALLQTWQSARALTAADLQSRDAGSP